MGYLLFEAEQKGFQTIMEQFCESLEKAGTGPDGSTQVEITVRGASEQKITFNTKGHEELLDIIRLNTD